MDALLNLLFLYIIFMLFGSLFRKMNAPKRSQNQQTSPASSQSLSDDIQAKFKQYAGKVEEFLTQMSPSQQSSSSQSERFKAPQEHFPSVEEQEAHFTLETTDRELEHLLTPDSQRLAQDMFSRSQRSSRRKKTTEAVGAESLIEAFRHPRTILQGVIMSEILGPPLSKRTQKVERKE